MKIGADYIYTLGGYEPLRNAWVECDTDGRVLGVGQGGTVDRYYEGALVPGFVNAHCHLELSHLHGKFRKGTGMAGFIDQINELRNWASHEQILADIDRYLGQMYDSGVSAMADISNCSDSFAAKKASKMYTRSFLEVFGSEPEDCGKVMEGVLALQKEAEKMGLDAAPTPHSCYTMSPELLSASAAAGLDSGYLSYHSQESIEEEEMMRYGTGNMAENRRRNGMSMPPVTGGSSLKYFLSRLNAASPAPYAQHILLVHNVCLAQEDIDAVKAVVLHPFFAICPLSNIFIHNALPPVELMRRNGLAIAIGTDSLSSNDVLDMVAEMNCLHSHFPEIPMGELLTWACLNGAKFLGKDNVLGTLSVGKCPGLVYIDNIDEHGYVTDKSRSHRIDCVTL